MAVTVTADQVRQLREITGAGMMSCKRALETCAGDLEKAIEYLREQGIAAAAKRETRETAEGVVACYIHAGGRIGVLVEVNCETDFVARTEEFSGFAHMIAMQVAAMQPEYVSRQDVPESVIEKEKEIYRVQAAQEGKPAHVTERIAEGKLEKFYSSVCLLDQPYIRDPDRQVTDLLRETAGHLGENISIRRFVRFQVGHY